MFTPGAAMIVAARARASSILIARRGRLNRGVFDAAQFSLAAGAGAFVFHAVGAADWSAPARIAPAVAAGAAYMVVNSGLLCLAMSLADGTNFLEVWQERFRWLIPVLPLRRARSRWRSRSPTRRSGSSACSPSRSRRPR